jgi:hypothetical protein
MTAIPKASSAATTNSSDNPEASWRRRFAEMMPAICRHARLCFKGLPADARAEAIQEVAAQAFVAYSRLVELGKEDVAYAAPLAKFAVHRVRSGRTVGGKLNASDVSSVWCQARRNIRVDSLHEHDGQDGWREIVVEDRRSGPAETAAARLDMTAWLRSLPRPHRQIAEALAAGETTSAAATLFNVSAARISQVRRKLFEGWQRFQGEGSASPLPNPPKNRPFDDSRCRFQKPIPLTGPASSPGKAALFSE